MVLFRNQTSTAAVLDFQETFVAVGLAVGAANRIVVGRADLLAATEQEALYASLHRNHVDVFPAIVSLHLALVAIELVVGTANKLTFSAADLVAKRGRRAMLSWNLNHPLTACLAPQMAKRSVNVPVASTNWFLGHLATVFGALFNFPQGRALADVSQLNTL